MHFANATHKETFERVRTYLGELFDEVHFDTENQHFYLSYGSTVLEISVDAHGPEDAVMRTMAYCVQGARIEEDLLRGLLELNHTLPFGAFSLVGEDIYFSHTLFGRTLQRANLLSSLAAVVNVADDYDDLICDRFGGERALDRIRHTGGRRQREQALTSESAREAAKTVAD